MGVILNIYRAAALTGLSPTLLLWLTSYAPKAGDPRKLTIAKKEGNTIHFRKSELLDFDAWLRKPWPAKTGARPNLPAGIKTEIKAEANAQCAMCHGHADSCEAAHVDPVAQSKNNHPHNLIWLCANHHTKFDNGALGPKKSIRSFIVGLKEALHGYKRMQWKNQDTASRKLFRVLKLCGVLEKKLGQAKTAEQREAIKKVAVDTLAKIPSLAPASKADKIYATYTKIEVGLDLAPVKKKKKKIASVKSRLHIATGFQEELRLAAGFAKCPLCKGSGRYDGNDCPICDASGVVEESDKHIDLSPYEVVNCPLCKGTGAHQGADCPVCDGDQTMQRRFADNVDTSAFDDVNCPVCKGSGVHNGGECEACHGDQQMPRRIADQIDERDYQLTDCPLCRGNGRYRSQDCPECHGDRRMEKRFADQVDLSRRDEVDCPLCKGKRSYRGVDCRACDGNGQVDRDFADNFDHSAYDMIKCPACKGKCHHEDGDCTFCEAEGKVERYRADRYEENY